MYDVLNVCLEVVTALGQGYLLQYFLGSFLEGRGKDRHINGLLVTASYGALRLGINFILPSDYDSIRTVLKVAVIAFVFYSIQVCLNNSLWVVSLGNSLPNFS